MGSRGNDAPPKSALILQGVGSLVLLGALPVPYKRRIVPAPVVWMVAVAVGAATAWLAIQKPS